MKSKRMNKAIDAIRVAIVAARRQRYAHSGGLVVVLTSRVSGEGVSTITSALADSFARHEGERVLVIEAENRGRSLTRWLRGQQMLALEDKSGGNGHDHGSGYAIEGNGGTSNLPVPQADGWGVHTLALSSSSADQYAQSFDWEDYFAVLRARYDVILVDAGSLETSMPYLWADAANQVLLVVDTTRTTVKALERLQKSLSSTSLSLTGVILNKRRFPIPSFLYGH